MPGRDPFAVLGLPPTASPDEVKAAYRAAARRLHPDVGGDEEAFKVLTRAADAALEIATGAKPRPHLPREDHTVRVERYDRHAHSPPPPPNVWSREFLGGALFWILPVAGAIFLLSAATGRYFLPVFLTSITMFTLVVALVFRSQR